MRNTILLIVLAVGVQFVPLCMANTAPQVNITWVTLPQGGSGVVDIYYDLTDADGDDCTVSVQISDDNGASWDVPAVFFSGDVGSGVSPGNGKHITWQSCRDLPGVSGTNYRIKVIADDGVVDGPDGMVWVYIDNDPGVSGHGGFSGYMSKYETTNAQYCQYLNAALASGDIRVSGNRVYGNSGEYNNQVYFDTSAYTSYSQITYSGGTFSVRSRDGHSMANHPVVEVSWYGATAFCNYYGWRLPTEWEWQAVADYDGSYTYGCGTTINQSKANYSSSNPLGLTSSPYTSPVDHYSSYGYGMNDMAGNAWEWTSSTVSGIYRVFRGGCWSNGDGYCTVSRRGVSFPVSAISSIGFRVCR